MRLLKICVFTFNAYSELALKLIKKKLLFLEKGSVAKARVSSDIFFTFVVCPVWLFI